VDRVPRFQELFVRVPPRRSDGSEEKRVGRSFQAGNGRVHQFVRLASRPRERRNPIHGHRPRDWCEPRRPARDAVGRVCEDDRRVGGRDG
jgi:hypothetical protein